MTPSHVFIQLASPNKERLFSFYRDTLQLPERENMGPDNFAIAPETTLAIVDHSEVTTGTREPARVIIDFWVEDIEAEQSRLEAQGIRFTRDKGLEFWGGVISTFTDPDGNTLQLIQYRPELAQLPPEPAAATA